MIRKVCAPKEMKVCSCLSCKTHFLLLKHRHVKITNVFSNIYRVCVGECLCFTDSEEEHSSAHGTERL